MNAHADSRMFQFNGQSRHTHGLMNAEGQYDDANDEMQKHIGTALARFYPGHPWAVMSEIEHGIVKIAIQGFVQWPFILHVATLKSDPGLKSVLRAGGELLERLKMPRHGFSVADWRSAMTAFPSQFHRNRKAPE